MQIEFTEKDLLIEKELIINYIGRKARHKLYPAAYLEKLSPLIEKMYNFFQITPNTTLLNDPDILIACEFAHTSHEFQQRKYSKQGYIIHPIELASRLSVIKGITKDQIIAALLHDVIEDSNVKEKFIADKFGDIVGKYLHYLTDHATDKDGNREKRTEVNFNYFKLSPEETKNIKLADLVSNSRTIALCDASFSLAYFPALKKMESYFVELSKQNPDSVDNILLEQLTNTIIVANEVMALQKQYNIIKLDKKNTKPKEIKKTANTI